MSWLKRRTTMCTFKNPVIAFFSLLAVMGAIAAVWPHTGFGQGSKGNGATKLNCDERPCDAVARGRAAFNDRNLSKLGGYGRACADCHIPSEGFQLSPAAAEARFDGLLARSRARQSSTAPAPNATAAR